MDILNQIYELLKDDPFMREHVEGRYAFNETPDAQDIETSYVTINPVIYGVPTAYADGKRIADANSARVDVFINANGNKDTNPRILCMELMERVADILDDNSYVQSSSFAPQYNKDYKLYRESRGFQINYYRSDY